MYLFILANIITISFIIYYEIYYNIEKLRNNWSEYRCNPIFMLFSDWIDPTNGIAGNFRKCMNLAGKDLVGNMTDIFGAQISLVIDSLSSILNPLKLFRDMFATIRKFILSFTNSTLQKASGPLSAFSFILIKIQNLMRKMEASGYVSAFFGLTVVSFIQGFITLFLNVVRAFVYALLAISIILIFVGSPLLGVALFIASLLAGA